MVGGRKKINMKKIGKTILGVSVGICIVAAGIFAVVKFIPKSGSGMTNQSQAPIVQRLDTVNDVEFDSVHNILSWTKVPKADGYKIDINGEIFETSDVKYYYSPQKDTSFKVQAVDSTKEYQNSEWSKACLYTVPEDVLSIAKVNSFVASLISSERLTKVVRVCYEGSDICTSAVFGDKLYQLKTGIKGDFNSLMEAIDLHNKNDIGTRVMEIYDVKDYISMECYLKSDTYVGTIEEYRQLGYDIEVVSSQAYRMSSGAMGADSCLKVSNGSETKYLAVRYKFKSRDTANESVKYTTALINIDHDNVYELSCMELSGDFAEYAEMVELEKDYD